MSNDRKNLNERADGDVDVKIRRDTGQSQDASRHQKDAAHHKGHREPQPGAVPDDGVNGRKTT